METADDFTKRKHRDWAARRDADRRLTFKDIGRKGQFHWHREAWTWMVQSNLPEKVFVIERLRALDRTGERAQEGGAEPGDIEYRFGYFIVGRIGRAAGRWTWGQFSPLIPRADLAKLLAKARREGTLLSKI